MITLEMICESLKGTFTDAHVWIEAGYLFIRVKGSRETLRLSMDRRNP